MKELKKIKLNVLSQSNLKDRDMSQIYGGNYCLFGDENKTANENSGKCSCSCSSYNTQSSDYYGEGLHKNGDFYKDTTSWAFC